MYEGKCLTKLVLSCSVCLEILICLFVCLWWKLVQTCESCPPHSHLNIFTNIPIFISLSLFWCSKWKKNKELKVPWNALIEGMCDRRYVSVVCHVFPPHVSIFGLFPVLVSCHYRHVHKSLRSSPSQVSSL